MSYHTTSKIDVYVLTDNGPMLAKVIPETRIEIVGRYHPVPERGGDKQNRGIWIGDINLPHVAHADWVAGIGDDDLNDLYIEFAHDHQVYFGGYTRKWQSDGKGGTTGKFRHSADPDFPQNTAPQN